MKMLVFSLLALALSLSASAQKLVFLFGHAEYASSVGKLRESNNSGLGIEGGVGVGLNKTFITGTFGYTWFAVNKRGATSIGGLKYNPYRLGVRRYILLKNLFVKGEAGVANMKIVDTDNKSTQFTTSFGAGLKLPGLEFVVDYNSVTKYGSWFGIKVGMAIGL